MSYLILTLVFFGALAMVHRWWKGRYNRATATARIELDRMRRDQERASVHIRTQQEALFNSMAEGLLLVDRNGLIQLANQAFIALFDVRGDIRDKSIVEALKLPELAEVVATLSREKQVLGYEIKLPWPNERWLQVNASAALDTAGRPQGAILVFHDLTRLKQLENTRKEFVANVSHELRTPLSLIKGYVETLLEGAKDNPEVAAKFLATIDRNAERLKLLIEDLLTISELESGRMKLNLEPVSLRTIIEKVLSDFRSRAQARGVKVITDVSELTVRADPDRLEQVLSNLVDNAIKYGRQDGNVTIAARVAGEGEIEVSVQDDGPGIPPGALERVFERFYRVDKARSREQGGTGLGLAIVKHLVQSHGGRVWARSEVGRGATFFLALPEEQLEGEHSLRA